MHIVRIAGGVELGVMEVSDKILFVERETEVDTEGVAPRTPQEEIPESLGELDNKEGSGSPASGSASHCRAL